MKHLLRLLLCGSFIVQPLLAQFGTDTFADSINWSTATTGSGVFSFNNRLEYLVSTPTNNDGVAATWLPGYAPNGSDWSVKVDLHLLSKTMAPPSESMSLGLVVSDKDNILNGTSNSMKVYQFRTYGGGQMQGFDSELHGGGGLELNQYPAYLSSSTTDSSLLISYDSSTKILSSYVSFAPGDAWTALQSVDIGSGQYMWGPGGFNIQLAAGSSSMGASLSFASGDAYFSNFVVAPTAIPEPSVYAAGLGLVGLLAAGLRRRFGRQ